MQVGKGGCVELQHGEKASRCRGQEDDEEAHV